MRMKLEPVNVPPITLKSTRYVSLVTSTGVEPPGTVMSLMLLASSLNPLTNTEVATTKVRKPINIPIIKRNPSLLNFVIFFSL